MHVAALVIHSADASPPTSDPPTAKRSSQRLSLKRHSLRPLNIDSELVRKILFHEPIPQHMTFLAPHTNRLPSIVLLFYLDREHAHAATKLDMIQRPMHVAGTDYLVTASVAHVSLEQLRAYAKAAHTCKRNVAKLGLEDLVSMFLCRDWSTSESHRIHMEIMYTRLEDSEARLRAKSEILKTNVRALEVQVEELKGDLQREATDAKKLRVHLAKVEAQLERSVFAKGSRAARPRQSTSSMPQHRQSTSSMPQHTHRTRASVGQISAVNLG